jgi:hypothetical protein
MRYGTSVQVRHVAQAIIVREEKEIAALRRAADAAQPALESAQ